MEAAATTRLDSFSDVQVKLSGEAAGEEVEWCTADEAALVKAVKAFPKGSAPSEKERCVR